MSIAIIGSEGSMGKRYQAILRHLGKDPLCIDLHTCDDERQAIYAQAEGYIIATPTPTHTGWIKNLLPAKKPILCEKPITKDVVELKELLKELEEAKTPFCMMYQYLILELAGRIGDSYYNYFRHGNDGLVWDCLQVIGLATTTVGIGEDSPIWRCKLNGTWLSIADMDIAYVRFVDRWLKEPGFLPGEVILSAHEKTKLMEEKGKKE